MVLKDNPHPTHVAAQHELRVAHLRTLLRNRRAQVWQRCGEVLVLQAGRPPENNQDFANIYIEADIG